MANALDSMTADDMRRLAEQRLRELDAQRKRAENFRKNKVLAGMRRLSVYVPGDMYNACRAAVDAVLKNAGEDVSADGSEDGVVNVTDNATAPVKRAVRKRRDGEQDV